MFAPTESTSYLESHTDTAAEMISRFDRYARVPFFADEKVPTLTLSRYNGKKEQTLDCGDSASNLQVKVAIILSIRRRERSGFSRESL
jgi:hypothetical protein